MGWALLVLLSGILLGLAFANGGTAYSWRTVRGKSCRHPAGICSLAGAIALSVSHCYKRLQMHQHMARSRKVKGVSEEETEKLV